MAFSRRTVNMFRNLMCWTLLIFAKPAALQAGVTLPPALSLDNYESLEWAVNDDPDSALPWAKTQLEKTDAETDPKRWVRALWFYVSLKGEWFDQPGNRAV